MESKFFLYAMGKDKWQKPTVSFSARCDKIGGNWNQSKVIHGQSNVAYTPVQSYMFDK